MQPEMCIIMTIIKFVSLEMHCRYVILIDSLTNRTHKRCVVNLCFTVASSVLVSAVLCCHYVLKPISNLSLSCPLKSSTFHFVKDTLGFTHTYAAVCTCIVWYFSVPVGGLAALFLLHIVDDIYKVSSAYVPELARTRQFKMLFSYRS